MYMSYCRFEGTLHELRACIGDVEEHLNEEAEYAVSENEIHCFRKMVKEMVDFLWEQEIVTDNGEIDEEMLDAICAKMREGCNE